jgi:hypothetical protein
MKIAILTANLGGFDIEYDPVIQRVTPGIEVTFHRFNDANFPPIAGLTPRMQYRIPKLFGWQMFPGYDIYIWLDGSVSFERDDSVNYFLNELGGHDCAFFKHPVRRNIRQEVAHIEEKLQEDHWYITPRYKNGLHKEQMAVIAADKKFHDRFLYTSTAFIYRNSSLMHLALEDWWFYQSRYFTCDQIPLPYVLWKHDVSVKRIDVDQYKIGYLSLMSHHK